MNNTFLFSFRSRFAAGGLFLGLACLLCASVNAQNLLNNPSFESPIDPVGSSGTTNWTVVYAYGGPGDFAYAGRTTEGCNPFDPVYPGGNWGAAIRPAHASYAAAYLKQIVTGLTNGASYTLSGWMHTGYSNSKLHVNIETYGGSDGTTLVTTPDATTTRTKYFLTNTASASGRIEVRVVLSKEEYVFSTQDPKFVKSEGWFDVFSLTKNP
jgi:hypothetical protein